MMGIKHRVPCASPQHCGGSTWHWQGSEAHRRCSRMAVVARGGLPSTPPSTEPLARSVNVSSVASLITEQLGDGHQIIREGETLLVSYEGVRGDTITERFSFDGDSPEVAYLAREGEDSVTLIRANEGSTAERRLADALVSMMIVGEPPRPSWQDRY